MGWNIEPARILNVWYNNDCRHVMTSLEPTSTTNKWGV
nr:MAG TPA: hypothetical protein [Caudoviricetes sp.]